MLLKLEPEHDLAVIEMGMSHAGEIAALAQIAQPEIGVVTNVAPVHLEFFDSIGGHRRSEVRTDRIACPPDGVAVLNADDEYVSQFGKDFRRQGRYCTDSGPPRDVRAENIESAGSRVQRSILVAGDRRERAYVCRWWERTTFITRWRRWPWLWSAD